MSSNTLLPGDTAIVVQTPSRGNLDGDQVRSACTAINTMKAYRSYVNVYSNGFGLLKIIPTSLFAKITV